MDKEPALITVTLNQEERGLYVNKTLFYKAPIGGAEEERFNGVVKKLQNHMLTEAQHYFVGDEKDRAKWTDVPNRLFTHLERKQVERSKELRDVFQSFGNSEYSVHLSTITGTVSGLLSNIANAKEKGRKGIAVMFGGVNTALILLSQVISKDNYIAQRCLSEGINNCNPRFLTAKDTALSLSEDIMVNMSEPLLVFGVAGLAAPFALGAAVKTHQALVKHSDRYREKDHEKITSWIRNTLGEYSSLFMRDGELKEINDRIKVSYPDATEDMIEAFIFEAEYLTERDKADKQSQQALPTSEEENEHAAGVKR